MNLVQASQFVPSKFIAQEPQIPSRHERRKMSVQSTLFLIQKRRSEPWTTIVENFSAPETV